MKRGVQVRVVGRYDSWTVQATLQQAPKVQANHSPEAVLTPEVCSVSYVRSPSQEWTADLIRVSGTSSSGQRDTVSYSRSSADLPDWLQEIVELLKPNRE